MLRNRATRALPECAMGPNVSFESRTVLSSVIAVALLTLPLLADWTDKDGTKRLGAPPADNTQSKGNTPPATETPAPKETPPAESPSDSMPAETPPSIDASSDPVQATDHPEYKTTPLNDLLKPFTDYAQKKTVEYKVQQGKNKEAYDKLQMAKLEAYGKLSPESYAYTNLRKEQERLTAIKTAMDEATIQCRKATWIFAHYGNPEAVAIVDEWKKVGATPRTCADYFCEQLKKSGAIRSSAYRREYTKTSPLGSGGAISTYRQGEPIVRIDGFDDSKFVEKLPSLEAVVYQWEYVSKAGLVNVRDVDVLCYKDRFGLWKPCALIYEKGSKSDE